jgi:hypothetical protein
MIADSLRQSDAGYMYRWMFTGYMVYEYMDQQLIHFWFRAQDSVHHRRSLYTSLPLLYPPYTLPTMSSGAREAIL